MNLNDCLRAVETGTSGKEHAEWLQVHIASFVDGIGRWIDYAFERQHERNEARAWAIRRTQERDKLEAELEALKARRCETCRHRRQEPGGMGYCEFTDTVWKANEECSRWEAKLQEGG